MNRHRSLSQSYLLFADVGQIEVRTRPQWAHTSARDSEFSGRISTQYFVHRVFELRRNLATLSPTTYLSSMNEPAIRPMHVAREWGEPSPSPFAKSLCFSASATSSALVQIPWGCSTKRAINTKKSARVSLSSAAI